MRVAMVGGGRPPGCNVYDKYHITHTKLVLTFECVTEGSVYDEQQYAAADSAKWRRMLLNPMLDEVANNLHTKINFQRFNIFMLLSTLNPNI